MDQSKFSVKRCFFRNQDFKPPSKIFLLFNHVAFTRICKELKLQRKLGAQIEQFWFQISASTFSLKSPGQCLL